LIYRKSEEISAGRRRSEVNVAELEDSTEVE